VQLRRPPAVTAQTSFTGHLGGILPSGLSATIAGGVDKLIVAKTLSQLTGHSSVTQRALALTVELNGCEASRAAYGPERRDPSGRSLKLFEEGICSMIYFLSWASGLRIPVLWCIFSPERILERASRFPL
jgi:hypothetical protein